MSESEGVAPDPLINVTGAEELSAWRTEDGFRERAGRANLNQAKRILRRAGKGKPPAAGRMRWIDPGLTEAGLPGGPA